MYVYIQVIRKIIQGAAARGASFPAMCKTVGLTPQELNESDRFYEGVEPIVELWQFAEKATGDPNLGLHIGAELTTTVAGLTGYLMNSCPTMKDALQSYVDHASQVTGWIKYDLQIKENDIVLAYWLAAELMWLPVNVKQHVITMGVAGYARIPGLLTGLPITPVRVELEYTEHGHLEECRRVMNCPVTQSDGVGRIHFRRSDMEQPLLSYDRSLHKMFSEMLHERARSMQLKETFADKVRTTLISDFGGQVPGITVIAAQMNMSGRTFQRKLEEEGANYRAIAQEVRKEVATQLLKTTNYTLGHIADLLGFSDASTFSSAYKQWTGTTPGSLRKAAVAGSEGGDATAVA